MTENTRLHKRLRRAGALILIGLLVELITIIWSHPTAFLFFLFLGGSLMLAGILFYLYSLVASGDSSAQKEDQAETVVGA